MLDIYSWWLIMTDNTDGFSISVQDSNSFSKLDSNSGFHQLESSQASYLLQHFKFKRNNNIPDYKRQIIHNSLTRNAVPNKSFLEA